MMISKRDLTWSLKPFTRAGFLLWGLWITCVTVKTAVPGSHTHTLHLQELCGDPDAH